MRRIWNLYRWIRATLINIIIITIIIIIITLLFGTTVQLQNAVLLVL